MSNPNKTVADLKVGDLCVVHYFNEKGSGGSVGKVMSRDETHIEVRLEQYSNICRFNERGYPTCTWSPYEEVRTCAADCL